MSSTRSPRAWACAITRKTARRFSAQGASKSMRMSVERRSHWRPKGVKLTSVHPRRTSSSRAAALASVPYPRSGCCELSMGPSVAPRTARSPASRHAVSP